MATRKVTPPDSLGGAGIPGDASLPHPRAFPSPPPNMTSTRGRQPERRIYYGWVIVAVVALVGAAQTGQLNPTIGVFIRPVTEEFGWSRSLFVGAVSAGTLVGGFTGLGVGPALDRFGPRWIMSVGVFLVGAALVSMSAVNAVWQFYLAMIVGRAAVQGAVNIGGSVTVSKWFIRRRGRAAAISFMGNRVGNGTTPLIAQALVSSYGWRWGFLALGLIVWVVALLPTFLLLRRQPEDMGLLPDGDPPSQAPDRDDAAQAAPVAPRGEVDFTLRQALATRAFYLSLIAMLLGMIVASGVSLNLVAYLEDQGLSPATAVLIVVAWSFSGSVGTLAAGFIGERVPIRSALIVTYIGLALSTYLLIQVDSTALGFLFAAVYGPFFGAMVILQQLILPDYFGRASLGAIRGLATPFQMGAIALGPIIATVAFDATGEYTAVFAGFLGCFVAGAGFLLLAPKPQLRLPATPR